MSDNKETWPKLSYFLLIDAMVSFFMPPVCPVEAKI